MSFLQGQLVKVIDLSAFEVSAERGFLSSPDPLPRLPSDFDWWEEIAHDLPKLLVAGKLHSVLDALPPLDTSRLDDDAQLERAMLLMSYLGHGYVWGGDTPAKHLPEGVAVPWFEMAQRLGRPPVLSYASYALHNWRRLDPDGPIALGNIMLLQDFLGGLDEEWFVLVHVDIEAKAAPALAAIARAQASAAEGELTELEQHLTTIASALEEMYQTLLRMTEGCDPYIYYHRVRPYLHGWKNNPALPEGVIYEGVAAYGSQPQQFRGETGAQSSVVPALDAALGISHRDDPLRSYLKEMRDYMPPHHRAFIEAIKWGPSIRQVVLEHAPYAPALRDAYNACIHGIERFRSKHLEYAMTYIQKQSQRGASNPTEVGTGGTPFISYLKKHRDETIEYLV